MSRPPTPIAAFANGGGISRNPSPIGGTYAWTHVDAAGNRIHTGSGLVLPDLTADDLAITDAYNCPYDEVTNNLTEFIALTSALLALPEHWSGPVHSDSQVTLGRLFWGWKIPRIPVDWIVRASDALARLDTLTPVLLDGHPTRTQLAAGRGKRGHPVSEHQVWCDVECRRVATQCPAWRLPKGLTP